MALYAALNIGFSASIALKLKNMTAGFLAAAGFLALHISYGCGTLYGLYTGFYLRDKVTNTRIKIEAVNLK